MPSWITAPQHRNTGPAGWPAVPPLAGQTSSLWGDSPQPPIHGQAGRYSRATGVHVSMGYSGRHRTGKMKPWRRSKIKPWWRSVGFSELGLGSNLDCTPVVQTPYQGAHMPECGLGQGSTTYRRRVSGRGHEGHERYLGMKSICGLKGTWMRGAEDKRNVLEGKYIWGVRV